MSRYLGPRLRITRRLGSIPGLTQKVSQTPTKRTKTPGQHGIDIGPKARRKPKLSRYAKQLKEKQKIRYHYGITERQLLNYVRSARKNKISVGDSLIQLLEMRLDNIVFRLGMAPTIVAARQLVNHAHIQVNGKKVTIPSYNCKINDVIQFKVGSSFATTELDSTNRKSFFTRESNGSSKINSLILRKDIPLRIKVLSILEYYSRKI